MTSRPNILLVHWHDLGRHLATYGVTSVPSPNVDALAAAGIRFDNAFCTTPLCSPARGSLFTGRYPHSNGLVGLAHLGWEYDDGVVTLPTMLRSVGYRSVLFGLQHESEDASSLGFDEVRATEAPCDCGPVTDAAVRWLRDDAGTNDAPFFAVVGFREVHRPYPPDRYPPDDPATVDVPTFLPDNAWTRDDLAMFQGCIRVADAAVGRLLTALDESGLADDTWVIFTTDHGMAFPRGKSTLYDPGIEVALIMRLPAEWRADAPAVVPDLISHVDVVPTVLDWLGVAVPAEVEGVSHAGVLRSGEAVPARAEVFAEKNFHDHYDPIRGVRTDRYKYLENFEDRPMLVFSGDIESSLTRRGYSTNDDWLRHRLQVELYDLAADPDEQLNRADDPAYADIRADLSGRLHTWRQATHDPLLAGPIPGRIRPRLKRFGALTEQ